MRRAVAAVLGGALLAVAGCAPAPPRPDRIGIYVAHDGELVPLPREHTSDYALTPWVKVADPQPTLLVYRPGVAVARLRLVQVRPHGTCGTEGACSEDVAFHVEPLDERVHVLRPDAPLEPDVYALVVKSGPLRDEVAVLQVLEPAALGTDELLARHLDAVGRARLDSLRVSGETRVHRTGAAGSFGYTFEMQCARPHWIRHAVRTQLETIAGYDGERAWLKRSKDAQLEWVPEADLEPYRRQALECLDRGLLAYTDLALLGREVVDDRPVFVVGAAQAGERLLVYVDAETLRIARTDGRRHEGRDEPWTRRFAQFTEFDGVTVPRLAAFRTQDTTSVTHITEFEPDVEIAPERFRAP